MSDDDEAMMCVKVPSALRETLKMEAVERGVTLRAIILRAFKSAGYAVDEADLADRRPMNSGRKKGE